MHIYNFVDAQTGAHTQNVERLWGSSKWCNKKHRGLSTSRQLYLIKFMWCQKHDNPFIGILNYMAEYFLLELFISF